MTVNAILTIECDAKDASEKKQFSDKDYALRVAYELGWTQSMAASILNRIEARYGEDALLKILDSVGISPVYSSAV